MHPLLDEHAVRVLCDHVDLTAHHGRRRLPQRARPRREQGLVLPMNHGIDDAGVAFVLDAVERFFA